MLNFDAKICDGNLLIRFMGVHLHKFPLAVANVLKALYNCKLRLKNGANKTMSNH